MIRPLSILIASFGLVAVAPADATQPACESVAYPAAASTPVGAWTINETICVQLPDMGAMISPGCVGSTQEISTEFTGTITFDPPSASGATYSRSVAQITSGEIRVPLTCLAAAEITCEGEGPMGPTAVEGDVCVIAMNQQRDITENGVWEISDHTVTVTAEGEGEEPKTLSIYADPMSPGSMWLEVHGRGGALMVMRLQQVVE